MSEGKVKRNHPKGAGFYVAISSNGVVSLMMLDWTIVIKCHFCHARKVYLTTQKRMMTLVSLQLLALRTTETD